tara:strand:- start:1194 stop:1664 length:471 start_codon:yes stop_codon:yes gene_type:complete
MTMTRNERVAYYKANGWCPVPWAHHCEEVKDELRRMKLRPRLKDCWKNSQEFFLFTELGGVTYHEGICVLKNPESVAGARGLIDHAWLRYEGEMLDLTTQNLKPLTERIFKWADVSEAYATRKFVAPVDDEALKSDIARLNKVWNWNIEKALKENK